MIGQKNAFKNLWDHVNKGGVFIMEDTHTSFMTEYMNDKQTTYQFLLDFCKEKNVKFKEFRRD
jgi:hypothetical protein